LVKFLEGDSFNPERVPVCTYWRSDVTTDPDEDFAPIVGTGDFFARARSGGSELENDFQGRALGARGTGDGSCIANAFFARGDITCFNDGNCNGTGQCLPCSKYRFEGMQLGISHSPPLSFLRQFVKGVTEEDLQSSNLISAAGRPILQVAVDQLPYGILLKNIMANIDKCCHWNVGDGLPSEFFLATIVDGPVNKPITDVNGLRSQLKGIVVTNSAFDDEIGTFFPVGTVVVAGFVGQSSFYLEPRTGLVKRGEGVIFPAQSSVGPRAELKSQAASATQTVIDSVNSAIQVCNSLIRNQQTDADFFNNALNTNNGPIIEAAQQKLQNTQANQSAACAASAESQTLGNEANALIGQIVEFPNDGEFDDLITLGGDLSSKLAEVAAEVEKAAVSGEGLSSAGHASAQAGLLRRIAGNIRQLSRGGISKCEFFFESNNVAEQWNDPKDGTLICNGVRTDCPFYTGTPWKHATDPNLESGQMIKAEALQEIRFRSDDWTRFSNPEQEFRNRFSLPFIWAFKQYVDVNFTPDPEDLILYRPKVLFGNDLFTGPGNQAAFETMQIERVAISNFEELEFSKSRSRIQPGADTLDQDSVPQFASIIRRPSVPSVARLEITHPGNDAPFVYRMWTPDKNKITLFGTGTPARTVYIVNDTALKNRDRYHDFLGTRNFVVGLPTALPGAPNFTGNTSASFLQTQVFNKLEDEKRLNDSEAVLGFDVTSADNTGFWQSIQEVDLVHNQINNIYVFILLDNVNFLVDSVSVDARFLHSLPVQSNFRGVDFTMHSSIPSEQLGINSGDTTKQSSISAVSRQLIGNETVGFDHGYYAWRFRDRNLRFGTLNADNDLKAQNPIADEVSSLLVTESAPGAFISSVAYEVIQYRKTGVEITDWSLIANCGLILIRIPDATAHRVLPMPNQQGNNKALSNVLVNGGAKGSVIAQFALEKATLRIGTETKQLVQIYRDPDGFGLPANYILLGPSSEVENAFGRPVEGRDTVIIDYTYLQAQDTGLDGNELPPAQEDEVVTRNFHADNLRSGRSSKGVFSPDGGLVVGGAALEEGSGGGEGAEEQGGPIKLEQQDWCFVYKDSDNRPIGRKITRFMVMYYNLACLNVEIFYNWSGSCQTYALIPDLSLQVGDASGTLTVPPKGTTDPDDPGLQLGFRIRNLIGDNIPCGRTPHCGDHELLRLGPLLREFEVIVNNGDPDDSTSSEDSDAQEEVLKANFPSAGGLITGPIVSTRPPGSQFQKKRGPMWYPYIACERPRYDFQTNGPLGTDSTELVNLEKSPGGISPGTSIPSVGQIEGSAGSFGGLVRRDLEAYHGPDRVVPKILDIHPSLRLCTSAFTYGNQVLKGTGVQFTGIARRRGEVDLFWYSGLSFDPPPFGNFGRPRLMFEVSEKVGDFVDDDRVGFRWMPMFPERLDMRAGMDSPFTEEVEPVHLRLIQTNNPVGSLAESIDEERVFTHKTLIQNVVGGGVEYPSVPFWPSFLPDSALGKAPKSEKAVGTISTQWAWRQFEKPISRGVQNLILSGLKLKAPDYFIDNRRLEVQLRPNGGLHTILWEAPEYNLDGALVKNAGIRLDDGPAREIIIDFQNRKLEIANQPDTVYDTSKVLGDAPFPCDNGTTTDNPRLGVTCSCDPDVNNFDSTEPFLPARFLHLDELAPEGFVALYENDTLQTPFALDLTRTTNQEPCCMCIYYIRGLFFSLDLENLPAGQRVNPAFSNTVDFQYTWSRVPHGVATPNGGQSGIDGRFGANENLADNYIAHDLGRVFVNAAGATGNFLFISDLEAAFPSRELALSLQNEDNDSQLKVGDLPPEELKEGAIPAEGRISQGQEEPIILDMLFSSYVKINSVSIAFAVGTGWQIPGIKLGVVDPQFRGSGAPVPTLRTSRIVADLPPSANGTSISNNGQSVNPNDVTGTPRQSDRAATAAGLPEGMAGTFWVTLTPDYAGQAFWNKFGQEFHLIFEGRPGPNSMGIAFIQLEVDSMSSILLERVQTFERGYFTSAGGPSGSVNPEEKLSAADSASAYWRTTDRSATNGANRFRAYAWGSKLNDGDVATNPPIQGDPRDLERLQAEEYDTARDLLNSPYTYSFTSFFPPDETSAIEFFGGSAPSFTTTLQMEISPIDQVLRGGNGDPLYGVIPQDRNPWHAPGHTWTYEFVENYVFCCFPCPRIMVIDFKFAHLHDGLAVVEAARFWDELPSGFTRLIRSTLMAPDVTFGQSQQSGIGITGGTAGQSVLLDEGLFNNIPVEVLENAGFRRDADGNGLVLIQGGE